jgi:hypothetical protein
MFDKLLTRPKGKKQKLQRILLVLYYAFLAQVRDLEHKFVGMERCNTKAGFMSFTGHSTSVQSENGGGGMETQLG